MSVFSSKTNINQDNTPNKQVNFSNKLDVLRLKVISIFNLVFILILIPAIIVEFTQGDFLATGIGVILIVLLLSSSFLIKKGYFLQPILITAIVIPALAFILALTGAVPYQAIFAELCLELGVFIWIINNKKLRILYTVVFLTMLFIIYYANNSLIDTLPVMVIITGFITPFHLLTIFLERQEALLFNAVKFEKETNIQLTHLNGQLENKNNELETLSYIMGHDLKAPLRTISSFSNLIMQKAEFDNNEIEYFNFILDSTRDMEDLINGLLLFYKAEAEEEEFENINLNDLINSICSVYQFDIVENKALIDSSDLPVIHGSPFFLKILFSNLISNAIKYQPKDRMNHTPEITIYSKDRPAVQEIYISDNGIGITKEYIKDLFEPFKKFHVKSEYKGTGLGMSICKRIMNKHKGEISLYKTSEEGTTILLSFPKNTVNTSGNNLSNPTTLISPVSI